MRKIIKNKVIVINQEINTPEFNKLKQEIIFIRQKENKTLKSNYRKSLINSNQSRNKNKELRKSRKEALVRYSKGLNNALPKSEIWFRELFDKEVLGRQFTAPVFQDMFNEPYNRKYIPDVLNRGYRYIIEIDGTWHDRADQKLKDIKKDYYFNKRNFKVIRIKAYDIDSYTAGISALKEHIKERNLIEAIRKGMACEYRA